MVLFDELEREITTRLANCCCCGSGFTFSTEFRQWRTKFPSDTAMWAWVLFASTPPIGILVLICNITPDMLHTIWIATKVMITETFSWV